MNYDGPMLTDSGGFQVFSLADTLKLDDDGLTFRSIYDGSKIRWTPESLSLIHIYPEPFSLWIAYSILVLSR